MHVFAARQLELLLDSAGDEQVSVVVQVSEIAGAQTAIGLKCSRSLVRSLVVTLHDVGPVDGDLAFAIGVARFGNDDTDARQRPAGAPELAVAGVIRADERARFGQAVALVD